MATNMGQNSVHNVNVGHNMNDSSQSMRMPSHLMMSRSQELNYVEALQMHQKTRLDHINNETKKLNLYLQHLRQEVRRLECQRQQYSSDGVDWAQKVAKLREDNRSLRIECHCLSMEVDLDASGQMPLGVTDENFYKNLPSGPYGPIIRPSTSTAQPQQPPQPRPQPPYPAQAMPRPLQPPSYEDSLYYPPPRFGLNNAYNTDLLRQVPPAPRPVWLSPAVQQNMQPVSPLAAHTLTPPLPPRPHSTSPRTPPVVPGAQAPLREEPSQPWVCEKCTVENHPALVYCEVCEMPRNGYLGTANRA